ncbi:ATP-binding protein [Chloroflexota bacterium]
MKRLDEVMNETGAGSSKGNTQSTSSTRPEPPREANQYGSDECPLCGGLGYLRENVPVGHPHFGQLFPCQCKLDVFAQQRLQRLRALSNLDQLDRMTFDAFLPEGYGLPAEQATSLHLAFDLAQQFSNHPEGWLVLFGGYGCGKTHLAAAIANENIDRGQQVLFVVVPDLLDYLRATYAPNSSVSYDERFEQVRSTPVLILDDLGTQSSTPWAQEKLFQILNYRYNARLPTVVTSNQSLEELDLRLRSRVVDPDLSTIVTIQAPDFRRSGVSQDLSDLSSLSLMEDMRFDRFDLREDELPSDEQANLESALRLCEDYAEGPDGWLVLTGPYGCGKTHLAAAIANARASKGRPALFIVVPDLLDHLRATFSPNSNVRFDKRFVEVKTASLLVLDDLGTESASPWAQEKMYQLLNHRYNARLPTVITTAQEIGEVEPRLRTRMLDVTRCTVFGIICPSYRGAIRYQSGRKTESRKKRTRR